MSDKDFHSYDDSYKNLIISSLGESSFLKARSFETLVIAERNQALGINPVSKMIKMLLGTKLVLNQALTHLAQLTESTSMKPHLQGWKNEIELATSATELGLICQRISEIALLPRPAVA